MDSHAEVYSRIDELLQLWQSKSVSLEHCHLGDIKFVVADDFLDLHDGSVHVQILQEVVALGRLGQVLRWRFRVTEPWRLLIVRCFADIGVDSAMDGKEKDTESLKHGERGQILINCLLHLRILILVRLRED